MNETRKKITFEGIKVGNLIRGLEKVREEVGRERGRESLDRFEGYVQMVNFKIIGQKIGFLECVSKRILSHAFTKWKFTLTHPQACQKLKNLLLKHRSK